MTTAALLRYFQFKALLQAEGWLSPAYVCVDEAGVIQSISKDPPDIPIAVEFVNGYALPGFQNSHSHAFQFAMAGMAEKHPEGASDDFWSWREAMYGCALSIDPDELEGVAGMLYKEMLRNGYTHVAEFHYLHHDKNGKAYANKAELGERLLAAAGTAGIKITLVPVFYQKGNFGQEPNQRQRRFISQTLDDYFELLDVSASAVVKYDNALLGFGVHSLRTVNEKDAILTFQQGPRGIPFHLHAAEQLKEVDDCIDHLKQRPIEWLLDHMPVDDRFNIVHGTHMNDDEVRRLAYSKANVVLCPGTEGNLGDGIFRLTDYAAHNGRWSIGTDSHISLNPLEDLRWLDYAQRLTTHKRNTFSNGAMRQVDMTLNSGRSAMGTSNLSFFSVGKPLDAVVYNAESPLIMQGDLKFALQSIIYTADSASTLGTIVNGSWVIKHQHHQNGVAIFKSFEKAISRLADR